MMEGKGSQYFLTGEFHQNNPSNLNGCDQLVPTDTQIKKNALTQTQTELENLRGIGSEPTWPIL